MYRVIKGDALSPQKIDDKKSVVIPHVCNNEGKWGAGFVLALSKKFPKAEKAYRKPQGYELGNIQLVRVDRDIWVANMIAQTLYNTPEDMIPLRYGALLKCMNRAGGVDDARYEIHCPMFGSGLAGGHWPTIEQMIKEVWVEDLGFDVTVYEFDPKG